MNPKLSVIVPTRNRVAMLAEFFESMSSVAVDYEILVMDGASTDGTFDMVVRQQEQNPRIRYFRNERALGDVPDVNWGLRESQGDYLCIFGDDDTTLPGNFERKTGIMDAFQEVGLVWSLWYFTDSKNESPCLPSWIGHTNYSYIGGRPDFADLLPGGIFVASPVVFRRSLWEECGGYDENLPPYYSHDTDLWMRYVYRTQTAFINQPLVKVRRHPASATDTAGIQGAFAEAKLRIWRKWLTDRENPPVVDARAWSNLHQFLAVDLAGWFPGQPDKQQHYMNEFHQLQQDYAARITTRFARESRRVLIPVEAETADPLQAISALPTIVWSGPIFERSGYGEELRTFSHALREIGIVTRLEDVHWNPALPLVPGASHPNADLPDSEIQVLEDLRWTPVSAARPHVQVWQVLPPYFHPD
ncbi:MAG: glycosyltransferase family 2 protein, partial [Chloroflexota bacterium]